MAASVHRARSRWERARGLIGTRADEVGALLFERVRQVHTFGMAYPIDVIFCDAEWRVVHVVKAMAPRRVTRWVRRARRVVELPTRAGATPVVVGDQLRLEPY
jgi:uncharacterized membrane protein (UPF0127 family)